MNILKKLISLEKEASTFGFKWENPEQIMTQIRSELTEIEAHLKNPDDREKLQEEIGDLLHAAFSLCVFCEFDPDEILENSVNKFKRRFKKTKKLAKKEGLENLNGQSFDKLMDLWDKAKKEVG